MKKTILTLTIVLSLTACKKGEKVLSLKAYPYYFTFFANDKRISGGAEGFIYPYSEPKKYSNIAQVSTEDVEDVTVSTYSTSFFNNADKGLNGWPRNLHFFDVGFVSLSSDELLTLEKTTYNYGDNGQRYGAFDESGLKEGVIIRYQESGSFKDWRSNWGTDQTSSSFEITDIDRINSHSVVVTGIFSCTLYDGYGRSIRINKGEFRAQFSISNK